MQFQILNRNAVTTSLAFREGGYEILEVRFRRRDVNSSRIRSVQNENDIPVAVPALMKSGILCAHLQVQPAFVHRNSPAD